MGNQLAKRPSPKGSRSSSIGDTKYDSSLSNQSQSSNLSNLSNHSFNSNSTSNNNNTSSKSKNNKNSNNNNNNNTNSSTSNKTHGNSNSGNGNTNGPQKNFHAQPRPSHEGLSPPSSSTVETNVASDHSNVKNKNKNKNGNGNGNGNSSRPSVGNTTSVNGSGSTGSTLTEAQGSHANPGVHDRSSNSHKNGTTNGNGTQGSVGAQPSNSSDTLINGVGKDPKRNSLDTQQPQQPPPPQPSSVPSFPEPSIPFAVASPGNPILVKRHLAPLSIAPGLASTLPAIRSPTAPISPNSGLSKSMELSPTSRKPFLGPTDIGKGSRGMDVDDMISRLLDAGYSGKVSKTVCLKNSEILFICQQARDVFLSQPTLIELNAPVKIVGDIHGQYTDLLRLFEMCGFPPSANFLFLGDYVDRGRMSLETILLLFCYKIKYPENFFLLRGNHECANVTKVYGFYDECKRRASIKMWKAFVDVFNCLPLAAIVANKIFCVHGGLSPSLGSMDDIRALRRPTDVPDYGLLNDLLWSDPSETALDWEDNERGVSYCFGRSIIQKFLNRHDFDLVCRAHMVVEDGYEFFNDRTLFDNFGAVMSVNEDLLCSFELLKPIDQATARAQMQSLAASAGGWRVNKQRLSIPDSNSLYSSSYHNMANT
ncbi:hypothetical protein BG000_001648 [Podila horticola]|nr:hypothetical protein BG000_001648 [Podila horticola]